MEEDLLVIAKEYELQGFQKNEDMLFRAFALEVPLNDVYGTHCPIARDYENRRDLIRVFNEIAKEIYGNHDECPVVEEFGSFLMDMFNAKSDLDLSINFNHKKAESQRDVKIKTLRSFMEKLHAFQMVGHVRDIQPIYNAKVPVLKVIDSETGIECDLSVGNLDGIAKSHIILIISAIDERFRKLSFLMKAWAKAHDVNSSKNGTLNSLSLVLLAAFHLQTRNPPILPPFSAIFEDGTDPVAVKKVLPSFLNYGKENKESLAELFVSVLIVLESVETLWLKGLCASVFEGSWVFKTWKTKKREKFGDISIEDFIGRTQNTARAVKPRKLKKIYSCIRHSLQQIQSFINGKIDAAMLKDSLFEGTNNFDTRSLHNRVLKDHTQKTRKNRAKGIKRSGATRVRHRSQETINGIQSHSFSYPSHHSSQVPTGVYPHQAAPYYFPHHYTNPTNESFHPPPTASREGATRMHRSQETTSGIRSPSFSHSSHSSQASTGAYHPQSRSFSHSNHSSQASTGVYHPKSHSFSHSSFSSQVSTGVNHPNYAPHVPHPHPYQPPHFHHLQYPPQLPHPYQQPHFHHPHYPPQPPYLPHPYH